MATVESGTQALRLGSIRVGEEFDPTSVYSSGTSAYFLLPNGYSVLSGAAFSENGPGVVPALGNVTGWTKYGYDGTEQYSFTGLNVPVATWNTEVGENDTTGLLTAALSGPDFLNGSDLADELFGFAGIDTLDGRAGADAMAGGDGDDIYMVDNVGDRVIETEPGGDVDWVLSSVTHTLADHVERLSLLGAAPINGTGNGQDNILSGNTAANVLNGGAGIDTMAGGDGSDTYIVDVVGDTVTEAANAGRDAVQSAVTFTLGANVENLTLTGGANVNGTGNTLANILVGNTGENTLDGGGGADRMFGGGGNDSYVIDNAGDRIIETATGGTDSVRSTVSHALATHVENLTLVGTAAINATGNAVDNTLAGNAAANVLTGGDGIDILHGGAGNDTLRGDVNSDTLDGGPGADAMAGGEGDDIYVVDNAADRVSEAAGAVAGEDKVESSITHTLATNVENLELTGEGAINGTGNALGNALTGNDKANILNGGAGADTMAGGDGDDTYIVDDVGDRVSEDASRGTDIVQSSAESFTLSANVENLTLTGTAAINADGNDMVNILVGNSAANELRGGGDTDTLRGNAGNDALIGGLGADTMEGGVGNDTYRVDDVGDRVTEAAGAGADTVESSIAYTLAANLENLTLIGTADIDGTGNAGDNTITGNTGDNTLTGSGGDDALDGGLGNDTFAFALGFGEDTISNWEAGDKISFDTDLRVANFAGLDDNGSDALDEDDSLVSSDGSSTVIDFGGGDVLTIDAAGLDSDDFIFVA